MCPVVTQQPVVPPPSFAPPSRPTSGWLEPKAAETVKAKKLKRVIESDDESEDDECTTIDEKAAVDEAKPAAEAPPSSAKKAKTELSASPKAAAPPLPKEAAPVKVEKSSKMDVEDDEEEEAKEPAPAPTQFAAYLSKKDKVVSKGAGTLKWVDPKTKKRLAKQAKAAAAKAQKEAAKAEAKVAKAATPKAEKPAKEKKEKAKKPKKEKVERDPDLPKKAPTAFMLFQAKMRSEWTAPAEEGGEAGKLPKDWMSQCGEKWKEVSAEDKAAFETTAAEKKEEYTKAMEKYVADHPDYLASVAAAKKEKAEAKADKSGGKRKAERDPAMPKRPPSSFMLFTTQFREGIKAEGGKDAKLPKDWMKQASALWKDVSDEEKATFEEAAVEEKEEYAKAMETYRANKAARVETEPTTAADAAAGEQEPAAGEPEAKDDEDDEAACLALEQEAAAVAAGKGSDASGGGDAMDEEEDDEDDGEKEAADGGNDDDAAQPSTQAGAAAAAVEDVEIDTEDEDEVAPSQSAATVEAAVKTASPKKKASTNSFFAPKKAAKAKPAATAAAAAGQTGDGAKLTAKPPATAPPALAAAAETEKAPKKEPTPPGQAGCKPEDYDPSKAGYDPIDDACWARGEPVSYHALATTFKVIEATTKRLEITARLRNFFQSVIALSPDQLAKCVYLCTNDLGPAYEGLELGIGDQILMKSVGESTGMSFKAIKAAMAKDGDLGDVTQAAKGKQRTLGFGKKPTPLLVDNVFDKFTEIAKISGGSSQQKKVAVIKGLLIRCKGGEAKYIIRGLGGKLRIRVAESTVLVALAHAIASTDPLDTNFPQTHGRKAGESSDAFEKRKVLTHETIKQAYYELPNYDNLLSVALKCPISIVLSKISLTPGIPLRPMLAKPTTGVGEVLKRFEGQEFACEWKYDGERAQIHMLENGEIRCFSRNQENNTSKYPDVIADLPQCMTDGVKSFIIDCEAVAYDEEHDCLLPFQVLSTRKKKGATIEDIKVKVILFPFDLLALNGKSFVRESFRTRRETLHATFKEVKGKLQYATSHIASDPDEIAELLDQSIKDSCEGLMVKTLGENSTYDIATRSQSWLKLKKDYLDGVGDTLDLVVIGAWIGKGKRTGAYGGFLLACYDPEGEVYQSICKIGTGFSDGDLKTHYATLKPFQIDAPKAYYQINVADKSLEPDVWFDAKQVWEVKCADLSISPKHRAANGLVDPEKGISLRFPRFLRIRDDKGPELATSAEQVADMYNDQDVVKNSIKVTAGDDDEEFY